MNKQAILDQCRAGHEKMLGAIDGLAAEDMLRPGAAGLWSVKDILAHITAWQSELVTALSRLSVSKQIPNIVQIEDLDEWNMEQYRVNAPRDLDIILEDFHGVHKHLLKTIEGIDDQTLTNPRRYPWMEGEPLSYLIAENGFWHEAEHAEEIIAWRGANGK